MPWAGLAVLLLLLPGAYTAPLDAKSNETDVGVIVPSISGVARASFFQYASKVPC